MDKYRFIKAQLAKTNKKNDENYVITRIWNRLDNLDIKFITQQYVIRPDGKYALTDMYFPQLGIHIEIDEGHHKTNIESDKAREEDIVRVTDHEVKRIDVTKGLISIHQQIEGIVQEIKERLLKEKDKFVPWDIEKELSPQTYIERGFISLHDNVAFRTIADACNCFGHRYKAWQKGAASHVYEKDTELWFPKLFPNGTWDNSISEDGIIILERNLDEIENQRYLKGIVDGRIGTRIRPHKRIVFAKVKGPLGDIMYRFKGKYQLNINKSFKAGCIVWERLSERIKTYPSR